MTKAFRWLWLGQLVSNLGTQCSLYGIGLWSFSRQGHLLDFAAVALVVQLAKVLVMPVLGRRLARWPRRQVMLLANGLGALCTVALAGVLLVGDRPPLLLLLPFLAVAAMAEAALVLSFASMIPVLIPEPDRLARANGLFVSSDGLVFSAAPFAGSWLVASTGLFGVLALDGLSFVVAITCVLLAGPLPGVQSTMAQQSLTMRLRQLWRQPASRAVLVVGTAMALVYAATEVLFPAWVVAGPGRERLGPAMLLGAGGYLLGYQLWVRWGWRRPAAVLAVGLTLQSLILMGAGLQVFQAWLPFWYGGLLVFSLFLPLVLAALQGAWQSLGPVSQLPQLLAQRYRLEWIARLLAFAVSPVLVDGLLRPGLAWPHWPQWLTLSLGTGAGRPLAVALGAMGWVLLLAWLSQARRWMRA